MMIGYTLRHGGLVRDKVYWGRNGEEKEPRLEYFPQTMKDIYIYILLF